MSSAPLKKTTKKAPAKKDEPAKDPLKQAEGAFMFGALFAAGALDFLKEMDAGADPLASANLAFNKSRVRHEAMQKAEAERKAKAEAKNTPKDEEDDE